MPSIPGFWDVGPHCPVPVEKVWRDFVRSVGGEVVEDVVPAPRSFENADFRFKELSVVAELKEIDTEFSGSSGYIRSFDQIMRRLTDENPDWKPGLLGGTDEFPQWFLPEYLRIFRPHLSRVLKKANRQIKETKRHFSISDSTGCLFLVNDGFASVSPHFIRAIACDLLVHSYSSIDCLVYLTVNRYVAFPDSDAPRLLWVPTYSERAPDALVSFIDDLGAAWLSYLQDLIGPFMDSQKGPNSELSLLGSASIVPPPVASGS